MGISTSGDMPIPSNPGLSGLRPIVLDVGIKQEIVLQGKSYRMTLLKSITPREFSLP